jgi:hypothetical protein
MNISIDIDSNLTYFLFLKVKKVEKIEIRHQIILKNMENLKF